MILRLNKLIQDHELRHNQIAEKMRINNSRLSQIACRCGRRPAPTKREIEKICRYFDLPESTIFAEIQE